MTNKEAIAELEELVIKQARIGLYNVEVEAIQHAIEVLKRFEGAVEVNAGNNCDQPTFVGNENFIDYADNHKLYAVPKEKK